MAPPPRAGAGRGRRPGLVVAGAAALAIVALAAALTATRGGIGVSRDSAVYLGTAERVADGDGLRVPFRPYPLRASSDPLATSERLENFPPLYPVVLAGLSRLTGTSLRSAARALNAGLLVGLVLMVAGAVWVASGRRVALAIAVALLCLLSIDVLVASSMVWTELLFTVLAVAALLLAAAHVEQPRAWTLTACAAVVALAFLTRLAGVALVLGVASSLLVLPRRPWGARVKDAAILVVAATLPVAIWMTATAAGSDRVANREAVVHLVGIEALNRAVDTVTAWALPSRLAGGEAHGPPDRLIAAAADMPDLVRTAAVLAAVTALVVLGWRRRRTVVSPRPALAALPGVLLVFLGAYAVFLLISGSLFDASLARFDHRILMPAHVVALLAAGVLVAQRVDLARFWRPALAVVAPFAVLLATSAVVSLADGQQFEGVFASERWRSSPIMAGVRDLPPDRIVVTNEPGAVWAIAGRSAASVPEQRSVVTLRANPRLDADVVALGRAMRARGAVLVYVDGAGESSFAAAESALTTRLPLRLVREEADGRMYEVDCPPEPDVC